MADKFPSTPRLRQFGRDESGTTAMIFGLSFIPVMFMLGASSDYVRAAMTRTALRQATDTAALSVASKLTPTMTDADAKKQAQSILRAQPRMGSATVTEATIATDRASVCVTSKVTINNSFMQIARMSSVTPQVKTCATTAPGQTLEIALVLDNSGSMSNGSKLSSLKTAAKNFIEGMFDKAAPGKLQMSVTPFASGVIAVDPKVPANRALPWIDLSGENSQHFLAFGGKSAANAAGFTNRFDIFDKLKTRNSKMDWLGCFETPSYPQNVQDVVVSPGDPSTLFVPYLAPDEPLDYDNNDYLGDNPSQTTGSGSKKKTTYACPDGASPPTGDWALLSRACKYNWTSALSDPSGSYTGPNGYCPRNASQVLMPMSTSETNLLAKIDSLVAQGNTNLHEGFMWGWRTISPNGPLHSGRAYTAANNRKIMVFMTDGFNNWSSRPTYRKTVNGNNVTLPSIVGSTYEALGFYSFGGTANERLPNGAYGDHVNYRSTLNAASGSSTDYHDASRVAQDELTLEACTNAKAAGVEVFTIGFSIAGDRIDAQGLALLKNCATNEDHYFPVENAAQLEEAFTSIGGGLSELHLSQ